MIIKKDIDCTGCGLCEVICPQNTLEINMSSNGFYQSCQVKDNCTECSLCEKVCPVYGRDVFNKPEFFYSAYSKNPDTRDSCSSGGIAHEIGLLMLSKGYKVCGVTYNADKEMAEHIICINTNDLEKIKGSKYIQSYTVEAFRKLFKKGTDEKYVVIGTPCQIAGIDKYAKLIKKRDNFLLVDFFCHGIPSYLLWREYVKHIKKKKALKSVKNIRFRDKKYGWHNFTIAIETNRDIYYSDRNRDRDLFYEMFLGNYCLNKSCYTCKFRTVYSKADIRVGDLWGSKYKNDTKGVSGVIVFTDLGQQIMEELRDICNIDIEPEEIVIEGQIKGDLDIPRLRSKIFADLRHEKSLQKIYNKRIIPMKVKRRLIRILRGGSNK